MEFSALETITITMLGSVFTAGVVRVWMGRSFVTVKTLQLTRESLERDIRVIKDAHSEDSKHTAATLRQLFSMTRALILYSDIPAEKKEAILNGRGE